MPPARIVTSWAARGTNRCTCSPTRMRRRLLPAIRRTDSAASGSIRPEDLSPALTAGIVAPARDWRNVKPVSSQVFEAWRSLYSFDHGDLKAQVESVDDTSPDWRREKSQLRRGVW